MIEKELMIADGRVSPTLKRLSEEVNFTVNNILSVTCSLLNVTATVSNRIEAVVSVKDLVSQIKQLYEEISSLHLQAFIEQYKDMESNLKNQDSFQHSAHSLASSVSYLVTLILSFLDQCTFYTHISSPSAVSWLVSVERRTICFSQCLTFLLTSFLSTLKTKVAYFYRTPSVTDFTVDMFDIHEDLFSDKSHLEQEMKTFWSKCIQAGFLVHVESLLSCIGNEKGMLEDMHHAITRCRQSLRICLHPQGDTLKINQEGDNIVISLGLPLVLHSTLPPKLRLGGSFEIVPILFTQGINEQQSFANWTKNCSIQRQINQESLCLLQQYLNNYYRQDSFNIPDHLRSLMHEVSQEISSASDGTKNVKVLLLSEQITRLPYLVTCGRITTCKSGKDRTAMAVTLEHALMLKDALDLKADHFHELLAAMRSENGLRILNVERNLDLGIFSASNNRSLSSAGALWMEKAMEMFDHFHFHASQFKVIATNFASPNVSGPVSDEECSDIKFDKPGRVGKFAFNVWQWMMLPEMYRPPKGMIGGYIPT
jgi:hypothetical protein